MLSMFSTNHTQVFWLRCNGSLRCRRRDSTACWFPPDPNDLMTITLHHDQIEDLVYALMCMKKTLESGFLVSDLP